MEGIVIAAIICIVIGSLWINLCSFGIISNLIALSIGVIFPIILFAIKTPFDFKVEVWAFVLAIIGFIVSSIAIVFMGHEELMESKVENGKTFLVYSGISVVAEGICVFSLYSIVSFFMGL